MTSPKHQQTIASTTAEVALATNIDDCVVNAVRDGNEPGTREHFSCGANVWNLLIELANSFGWKPLGTCYVSGSFSVAPDQPTRHDYQPGDQRDSKLVIEGDAIAWAAALSEARSSPHLNGMLSKRLGDLSTTAQQNEFHTTLDDFIAYAYAGAFAFSSSH